jgi:tetratricopeptide (TPR) repeat protein
MNTHALRRSAATVAVKIAAAALVLCFAGCGQKEPTVLEQGLTLYRQNQLEQALPLLQQAAEERADDPDVHAWLAETHRRLGHKEQALQAARRALELDPCHSFGHDVMAAIHNPTYGKWSGADPDSTWHHLMIAADCDSSDGNVWSSIWVEAIRRGDPRLADRAASRMHDTGFFTPALLAYNRWMLRYLPQNAILITNGDMDTYPAVALQEAENFRSDVVVVNRSLLNTTWYLRYLRDHRRLSLPVEDALLDGLQPYRDEEGMMMHVSDQIIRGWMQQRQEGQFGRPIAISVTVGERAFDHDTRDHLRFLGPFHSWYPVPASSPVDTSMLQASLKGLEPDDFAGPWVSKQDRSPVRRVGTGRLATNITAAALRYSEAMLDARDRDETREMLRWAERFEKATKIGPQFEDRIEALRDRLKE